MRLKPTALSALESSTSCSHSVPNNRTRQEPADYYTSIRSSRGVAYEQWLYDKIGSTSHDNLGYAVSRSEMYKD